MGIWLIERDYVSTLRFKEKKVETLYVFCIALYERDYVSTLRFKEKSVYLEVQRKKSFGTLCSRCAGLQISFGVVSISCKILISFQ